MKIKEYVEKYAINQAGLARKIGISPQYLGAIMDGRRTPSLEVAADIVDICQDKVGFRDLLPTARRIGSIGRGKVNLVENAKVDLASLAPPHSLS